MTKAVRLLVMLAALLTLVLVGAVAAQTGTVAGDVTALAAYFPPDTIVFAAARTDADYRDALSAVYARFAVYDDSGTAPASLDEVLDEILVEALGDGVTFADDVAPWLGDSLAVGTFLGGLTVSEFAALAEADENDEFPFAWAISVTDGDAALDFVRDVFDRLEVTADESTTMGFTMLDAAVDDQPYTVAVSGDVMFGGTPELVAALTRGDRMARLNSSSDFTATLGLLEADSYNIVSYLNSAALLEVLRLADEDDVDEDAITFLENGGSFAFGATILDDGSAFTLDFATTRNDIASGAFGPVDAAFAGRLPADVPLVIHGTNLLGALQALDESTAAATGEGVGFALEQVLNDLPVDVDFEGTLDFLTGDYALTLGITPAARDASSIFSYLAALPLEFSFVADASADSAAAALLVDRLEEALTGLNDLDADEFPLDVAITRGTVGDADNALVATFTDPTAQLPFPIELVVISDDAVFAVGTRAAVTTALSTAGGLAGNPAFQVAGDTFLTDPNTVLYIGFPDLLPLTAAARVAGEPELAQRLRNLLSEFISASITASVDGDVVRFRAVITLS